MWRLKGTGASGGRGGSWGKGIGRKEGRQGTNLQAINMGTVPVPGEGSNRGSGENLGGERRDLVGEWGNIGEGEGKTGMEER